MRHPFLQHAAERCAAHGIGTYRYEFPYMMEKRGRPDKPDVAEAAVRAAVAEAAEAAPGLPLLAGGKSFGGRMTSQAQAHGLLPGVRGLVFLGFPLHPPGKPGTSRAEHLNDVQVPMLFLQGTRDEFAQPALLQEVMHDLGERATLHLIEDGDHSFKVPKRVGTPEAIMERLATTIREWADAKLLVG